MRQFLKPARCGVKNIRGGAMVEFALVLPILLVMVFGTYELHTVLRSSETASRVALQTADLVARETVTTASKLTDLREMTRISLGIKPADAGKIVIQISSIGFNATSGVPELRWSSTSGSTLPITLADANGLGSMNESVIQVLTSYEHTSQFSLLFPKTVIYKDVAWARPRNTRLITLDGVT